MPTMQQSIVALSFTLSPAASPGGQALPSFGLANTTDIAMIPLPFQGTIVGMSLVGNPAAGDTITVIPQIASNKNGGGAGQTCASLACQATNAAPAATAVVSKDQGDCQFAAGQFLGFFYQTTTGGAYTVKPIVVTVFISTGRTDI